jgi:D-lactate dehydrogenase
MTLPASLLDRLRTIFPGDALDSGEDALRSAARDHSRHAHRPDVVVHPATHAQVEALVRACREHRVPLTARGGGTSSTGASVPLAGGVVANFQRMDRIVRIAPDDRLAVVEPGVTNEALQQALAPHGFFWAPDPGSAPWCTIGGNLACNAGGPRALKYGATRDNVLGLRAVAGTGAGFVAGTHTTKDSTGYDLTRLLIGSEGTLALVTEATLKLTPRPAAVRSLRATYHDTASAAQAVARIMAQPVTPAALEFMDALALKLARDHVPDADVPEAGALLLIEVDGTPVRPARGDRTQDQRGRGGAGEPPARTRRRRADARCEACGAAGVLRSRRQRQPAREPAAARRRRDRARLRGAAGAVRAGARAGRHAVGRTRHWCGEARLPAPGAG